MKTLLAAALVALPLVALAGDAPPAKTMKKAEVPAELYSNSEGARRAAAEAETSAARPQPAKAEHQASPEGTQPAAVKPPQAEADAKAKAKTGATKAAKKAEPKKDEKPCEPVKPCSID